MLKVYILEFISYFVPFIQVMSLVVHHFAIPPMNKNDRKRVLETIVEHERIQASVDFGKVAEKTAGFVLGDLAALIEFAQKNLYNRELEGWVR